MNSDLGVWTADDCALVLIDYQKDQLESIRSETSAELVAFYARWLARTARAFDVPIVLSTIGVEIGFNGPTDPAIQAEMPDVEPIDRTSMNSFEDEGFRQAIEATGRKRLIFGALQTEVCLAFAVVDAVKRGYDAMFVTDATGSRTQAQHRTAIERLAHAGAVPRHCGRRRDRTVPRLGRAARRRRPRDHQLVLRRSRKGRRQSRGRRGRETPRPGPTGLGGTEMASTDGSIGIIGAGRIGQAMARTALRAGRTVAISNSRGPETLTSVVETFGEGVSAGTVEQASAAAIVVLAVPWGNVRDAVDGLEWNGQVVIDATNDFDPSDLGGRTSSEVVADLVSPARVVKAANTLGAAVLASDPQEGGGQRVIFVSGDDVDAKSEVVSLFEGAGFAAIDLGGLATGAVMQQVGGPLAGVNLIRL